ncbi:hypothetical protein [Allonocardiopsis opalescens]|uniref:Uncharacterized protein n=1 Tax=Allonocardiopsis opalescens TaxID=1144618 RepID=A0A2T0PPE4_9ACTN|nr:hypothetical protein [Allonocardiopsis opalescens]PRX90678.1 hypothetical protein CLV72_11816 [Allonocardiopsis opalescens]
MTTTTAALPAAPTYTHHHGAPVAWRPWTRADPVAAVVFACDCGSTDLLHTIAASDGDELAVFRCLDCGTESHPYTTATHWAEQAAA